MPHSSAQKSLGLLDVHRDILHVHLLPYLSTADFFILSFTCKFFYEIYTAFFSERYNRFPTWIDIEYAVGSSGDEYQLFWLQQKLKFPLSEAWVLGMERANRKHLFPNIMAKGPVVKLYNRPFCLAEATRPLIYPKLRNEFEKFQFDKLQADQVTCAAAAELNRLDVLQFLRCIRKPPTPWDERVCTYAAKHGHFELLRWAREHGAPWSVYTCWEAAAGGHFHILRYLHEHGCPWNSHTAEVAAANGRLAVLKYVAASGLEMTTTVTAEAAAHGRITILRWLVSCGKLMWTPQADDRTKTALQFRALRFCRAAAKQNASAVVTATAVSSDAGTCNVM